tara:strand:- start:4 stop:1020 length:1017 start_codon:yes stop_codon:yes gene_type:complete
MNIENEINNLRDQFNNLKELLSDNNDQLKKVRDEIKNINNQINKLKKEKYYSFYQDDLEFQMGYYCNIYKYKKGLLEIKKNKIFYDIFIYVNLVRYLIQFSIKHLKSNSLEFKNDIKFKNENCNNNMIKKSDIICLFDCLHNNFSNLKDNIINLEELIIDLNPKNICHNLILDNIENIVKENHKTIKAKTEFSLNSLKKIINYHTTQLDIFKNDFESELNFIKNDIYYDKTPDMKVRISIISENEIIPESVIRICVFPLEGINYNMKVGFKIEGVNNLDFTKINKFNSEEGFYYDYQVGSEKGESTIKVYLLNNIFGNKEISCEGDNKFLTIEPNSEI